MLYTCNRPHCLEHGRVVRRNLAAIGIDVEVKNVLARRDVQPPRHARGAVGHRLLRLVHRLRRPVGLPRPVFAAPLPGRLQRRVAFATAQLAAIRIARASRTARARAFAELDADFARAGAAAPFATGVTTDFFSDRIGCQVHQPIYGISLGALCVRDQ